MTTVITALYAIISGLLILIVLLQAGKGGGMGAALGGGATQSVFGGSGGADFLQKVTYGLACGFMLGALYLAYASAHTGSTRLQEESEKLASDDTLVDAEGEVDYERIGPNPLPLPAEGATPVEAPPEEAAPAEEDVPADEDAPVEDAAAPAEPPANEDPPTDDRATG